MGKSRDACSQWGNELVLNQRKRVGRLRLLITALVVTTVSVIGAAGTAAAVPRPNPSSGVLEICKAAAGNERFSGTFGFKVQGVDGVIAADLDRLMFKPPRTLGDLLKRAVRFTLAVPNAVQPRLLLFSNELARIETPSTDLRVHLGINP